MSLMNSSWYTYIFKVHCVLYAIIMQDFHIPYTISLADITGCSAMAEHGSSQLVRVFIPDVKAQVSFITSS